MKNNVEMCSVAFAKNCASKGSHWRCQPIAKIRYCGALGYFSSLFPNESQPLNVLCNSTFKGCDTESKGPKTKKNDPLG